MVAVVVVDVVVDVVVVDVVVVDVVVVDVVAVAGWTARRTCTVCGSRATRATPPTRSARTTATRSARTTATTTKRRPAVPARRPTAAAGGSTGSFFFVPPSPRPFTERHWKKRTERGTHLRPLIGSRLVSLSAHKKRMMTSANGTTKVMKLDRRGMDEVY